MRYAGYGLKWWFLMEVDMPGKRKELEESDTNKRIGLGTKRKFFGTAFLFKYNSLEYPEQHLFILEGARSLEEARHIFEAKLAQWKGSGSGKEIPKVFFKQCTIWASHNQGCFCYAGYEAVQSFNLV